MGFQTLGATTTDGRTATMMVNLYPGETPPQDTDIRTALATALCETETSK